MRVLFLSDTHLGFDLPSRPRVERRRRGHDFFDSYERALDPARQGRADVVVHGGDLLYRSRVPAWLVDAALAPLRRVAAAGVPVLLLLGNHERSRLPFPLLALHDGLHVFDRPRTVVVEREGVRVAFTGFPYVRNVRQCVRALLDDASRGAGDTDVRVLCMHQCVEGATCGPGNYVFRHGDEVIRQADLPRDVAAVLCGHIHRHQVLQVAGGPPVIYAGSTERTSTAEAPETKGVVTLELSRDGLRGFEFHALPTRPMIARTLSSAGEASDVVARVGEAIASTPPDAVVHLRLTGPVPAGLGAAELRAMGGRRNVTLAPPREFFRRR
jgi:DNA repair exonuclease SbcCD nuclease subunit